VRPARQRGFSLLEVTIAMTVFGIFLIVFFILTAEMRGWEKRLPVNLMRNPQIAGVLGRMRRDVQDAWIPNKGSSPWIAEHDSFTMDSPNTLILNVMQPTGGNQIVVWDFNTPGVGRRISYNVGFKSEWHAAGLPAKFRIEAVEDFDDRPYGVRISLKDSDGKVAIDQILQPRTHK
jgi:prepilin-type N-terminal cleavage/methylation domain-containing protein